MISVATLIAVASLGLAQTPSLGIACPNAPNVTSCGRIGISVTLKRPALAVEAELAGKKVRLDQGGFAGRGPKVWQGYVHLNPRRLGLPSWWDGSKPVKYLRLHLTIYYPTGRAHGTVRVQLRPGFG
jgi:hypothetical protein